MRGGDDWEAVRLGWETDDSDDLEVGFAIAASLREACWT